MSELIFYFFAAIIIIASCGVILLSNPVHAILCLILTFIASGILWLQLNAEFLAITLILVYVGAVMVLFLFVVMMLNIKIELNRKNFWRLAPISIIIGFTIFIEIARTMYNYISIDALSTFIKEQNIAINNSQQIGNMLYLNYSYPVELASIILLLGLIVAVAIIRRDDNSTDNQQQTKRQNIAKQVSVNSYERIKINKY